jgi:alkanesulfonate monooxygenase SsuD/methylene tetrahydromethanopterin reductase-like flavin-dependent oxidoreductase (luciferase family)
VAAITNRVELGPLVLCTTFRSPALIAKMAATVEEISGGRLILGLGAGWHQPEYEAFGFPYEDRFARFVEAFTIIRTLLREREIDFAGKHYNVRDCQLRPFGPRPDGPPLMIGSRGEQMLAKTLPYVDAWNGWYAWTANTTDGYRTLRDEIDAACNSAGRSPSDVERTMAILLRFPEATGPVDPRAQLIQGAVEVMAEAILALAAEGVAHIQVVLEPCTAASVERFARVLELVWASALPSP